MRVDALSKLVSTSFIHLTKKVLVEVLPKRSIDNIIKTDHDWTKPLIDCLLHGVFPNDPTEARKVKAKAP